jgi:predicted ATPase/DNA-binding SARP family transcriptional activator
MGLTIEVLGPLRVRFDADRPLTRSSHRRLLSILALDANRRVGTDVLIDRCWGETAPATAKAALQTHISALRKLLPEDVIATEGYGYRLDLGGHALDAAEFDALAAETREAARTRQWQSAVDAAETALALWRGPPYGELEDDDFAQPERARLEELRLELLETRAEALLGLGRNDEALPDLERLVREHPLRERLWEHLMTARYRSGRHAEALEAYREAWAIFAQIGLEPSATLRRLEQKILLHDAALSTARTPHNLPVELSSFVGRETELRAVAALLAEHRLVTLTGVGGSGKTRLAIRVAADALERFPDGCWLAELGPLRDPKLVPFEVAGAIGLRPEGEDIFEALTAAIGADATLVVLDNCEHLLEGAAVVARRLVEAGPEVTVLATSREPLRVPGEAVYEVPPMSFPEGEGEGLGSSALDAFDAVRLFGERALLARPSFVLKEADEAVTTIARRLDGIPLAIELAAARVGSMRPEAIAQRLDDRFRILTGGSSTGPERHRTLESAFAWSYDLLDDREQLVFRRLSVFRGGFTLEAAEDVCGHDGLERAEVVPLLATLVDKSLVSTYEAASRERYRLLETVRDFAAERLAEVDEPVGVRRRHLEWCVRFAEDVTRRLYGADRSEVLERLGLESDNLEAALERAEELGPDRDVEVLAQALGQHWLELGYVSLAAARFERALDHHTTIEAEADIRGLLSVARFQAGDGQAAYREAEQAYELVADRAPSVVKVWTTTRLANMHWILVDRDAATGVPLAEEAVADAEALGDAACQIRALDALGQTLAWSGRLGEGLGRSRTAFDLALDGGDQATVFRTYEHLISVLYLDPVARRSEPARVAHELLARIPLEEGEFDASGWLGWVLLQSGDWDRVEQLLDRLGERHLEGYERNGYLVVRATLRWMQGRFGEAASDLAELRLVGVNPRWYHDYFPLVADVAADDGRLADVRDAADTYLAFDVDPTEEAKKVAVLAPLARAEADAAVATTGAARADHVERARGAVCRAREILEAFPSPSEGAVQMETHTTRLAFAEAELSRVDEPDPELWRTAVARADFLFFRLYARWRLAEALAARGQGAKARREIRATHAEADRVGAAYLRERLRALAGREGVELGDPATRSRARGSRSR